MLLVIIVRTSPKTVAEFDLFVYLCKISPFHFIYEMDHCGSINSIISTQFRITFEQRTDFPHGYGTLTSEHKDTTKLQDYRTYIFRFCIFCPFQFYFFQY